MLLDSEAQGGFKGHALMDLNDVGRISGMSMKHHQARGVEVSRITRATGLR